MISSRRPPSQLLMRAIGGGIHGRIVASLLGAQLNHVAVWVTEVNGMDKLVVRHAPCLYTRRLAFGHHLR